MKPTSKICYNICAVRLIQKNIQEAIDCLQNAVLLDEFFALGYFLLAYLRFEVGELHTSKFLLLKALSTMRTKDCINYEQLGMNYILYSCEIRFNLAIVKAKCLECPKEIFVTLMEAYHSCKESKHNVIKAAISEEMQIADLSLFRVPIDLIFRPPESKCSNSEKINYLGNAISIYAPEPKHADSKENSGYSIRSQSLVSDGPESSIESLLLKKTTSFGTSNASICAAPTMCFKIIDFKEKEFGRFCKLSTQTTFQNFIEKLVRKNLLMEHNSNFLITYLDADGDLITITDEEDFQLFLSKKDHSEDYSTVYLKT